MKKLTTLLFIFAIFLRFYFFWEPSFSSDEAHYVMSAVRVAQGFKGLVFGQNFEISWKNLSMPFLQAAHGPAEFLVIIPSIFFQHRELFVRFVFVLISIVSLIFCYLQLKKLRSRWVALSLLLFVGTSKYAILWSQTAMYQALSISVVLFIIVRLISFEKNPNKKNLIILFFFQALGLLVFPDLILYLPATFWVMFDKRKQINWKDVAISLLVLSVVAGVYYVPWILHGFFGNDPGNGFRFLVSHKLVATPDPLSNFKAFLSNFFTYPGVYILLPFAFLSLLRIKKVAYLKYLWVTIIVGSLVYIFKSYIPYYYFVSLFSAFAVLASEGIMVFKRNSTKIVIFAIIMTLNFIGLIPFFNKNYNTFVTMGRKKDEIKKVGEIIKKCGIADDETYLSTADFGRAEYYFGRQSTIYQDGQENRIKLMMDFKKEGYGNVKYIHFVKGELNKILEKKLREKSQQSVQFNNDVLFIYKNCLSKI